MAFDGPDGGDPWNVRNDVKEWQVVIDSRVPLIVGDSAVCRRDLVLTAEKARGLLAASGKPGAFLSDEFGEWLGRNPGVARDNSGRPDAWPIWDEVTAAYLLGMTRQEARPRPRLRDDRTLEPAPGDRKITWITKVDGERLWADLAGKLR